MTTLTVDSDLDRIASGATRAAAAMPREMVAMMTGVQLEWERSSVLTAPVDRGFYRGSITGSVTPGSGFVTAQITAGGPGVDYAGYINRGTSRMRARPHIRRAAETIDLDRHVGQLVVRIQAHLRRG